MTYQTTATASQPHVARGGASTTDDLTKPSTVTPAATSAQNSFVAMVLAMSWQLAVVVVVPIVGGHYLDQRLHTAPWLILLGVLIAGAGMLMVMVRIVGQANSATAITGGQQ